MPTKHIPIRPDSIDEGRIIADYIDGASVRDIAEMWGFGESPIRRCLKQFGVPMRSRGYKAFVLADPGRTKRATYSARTWKKIKADPERYARFKDRVYFSKILSKYRITRQEYDAIVVHQGGKCAICDAPPLEEKRIAVDHDHATGEARGLLCDPCNHMLGRARDCPGILEKAVAYLQDPPVAQVRRQPSPA